LIFQRFFLNLPPENFVSTIDFALFLQEKKGCFSPIF